MKAKKRHVLGEGWLHAWFCDEKKISLLTKRNGVDCATLAVGDIAGGRGRLVWEPLE